MTANSGSMSDLSPAAQKILDALGVQGVTALELVARGIAAAAIRTAADQLINVKWSVEMWELHHELHVIATELEGTNGQA